MLGWEGLTILSISFSKQRFIHSNVRVGKVEYFVNLLQQIKIRDKGVCKNSGILLSSMTEHKMAELMSVLEQLRAYPSLKPMLTTMQLVISWLLLSQRRVIAQLRRYWHLPSFSIYFHKGLGSWSRAALFYQKAYLFSTSLPPLHFISNWNHCNYFFSFFFGSFHWFESVHSHPNHHFLLIVS